MDLKVHHVGYAVPSLEDAKVEFELLGWVPDGDITDDISRKVRIQFLHLGNEVVELVSPLTEDSPVRKILQKGNGTPYHICYEADSLEAIEAELKARRFIVFQKPSPAPAIGNRRVEWFYSRNNGIIEVVEKQRNRRDNNGKQKSIS